MRLSAKPETCPRAAALSALYIAMGESLCWPETTALSHRLGSSVSTPGTFPPTRWAAGRGSCPRDTGRSQLAAPGTAYRGLPRAQCGQSRQRHHLLLLPVPPAAWRPGRFGTWSSLGRRAERSRAGSLPAATKAPCFAGTFRLLALPQGFGCRCVFRPAVPGVQTHRLQLRAQGLSGGGGDEPGAGSPEPCSAPLARRRSLSLHSRACRHCSPALPRWPSPRALPGLACPGAASGQAPGLGAGWARVCTQ